MIYIADQRRFRVYALDFWGFGESAKEDTPPIRIKSYVSMVYQFMEYMGILQAPVIGHSMGGTVSLQMTLDHPDRVAKAAVVGSPMVGSSLNLLLKMGGVEWIADTLFRFPPMLRFVIWFVLAGDSKQVQKMILRDVSRTNAESFFRSIGDLRRTDLRPRMAEIKVPTLGIFGTHDNIVHPNQSRVLGEKIRHARVQMMSGSRHFPMLDEPELFRETLLDFLTEK
jgi:pimeloyl-ACP methyl ester carboxylesterase